MAPILPGRGLGCAAAPKQESGPRRRNRLQYLVLVGETVKRSTLLRALAAAGVVSTAVALAAPSTAAPTGPKFGAPVKVTPELAGGYEPGIYADRFGNLYSTAHKENAELALSPDSRSSTLTRSMSWT